MRSTAIMTAILGGLLAASSAAAGQAKAGYDVTVLQDVGGQGSNAVFGMNAFGSVVGVSSTASGLDAALWSPSGKGTVLQDAGGQGVSFAYAINAFGWSVGTSNTANGGSDAVLWSPSGKATVLQDAGGQGNSGVYNGSFNGQEINNAGWSVGYSRTASGGSEAVLWSPSGKARVLQGADGGALAINDAGQSVGVSDAGAVLWSPSGKATVLQDAGGQGSSQPTAINAFGQSVGYSRTASGAYEAVLWSPSGKATVLQDAGGEGFSQPNAINAAGWSVGFSNAATASFGQDAVLWSPSGKATVLQDAGGQGISGAFDINDLGWSVGESFTPGFNSDAVLWSPSGNVTDLGTVLGPAWSDTEALGINDLGDIFGNGNYQGGSYGFLLTPNGVNSWSLASISAAPLADPVPEPSTWAMMLVGFAGLGFVGLRSRAAKLAS